MKQFSFRGLLFTILGCILCLPFSSRVKWSSLFVKHSITLPLLSDGRGEGVRRGFCNSLMMPYFLWKLYCQGKTKLYRLLVKAKAVKLIRNSSSKVLLYSFPILVGIVNLCKQKLHKLDFPIRKSRLPSFTPLLKPSNCRGPGFYSTLPYRLESSHP